MSFAAGAFSGGARKPGGGGGGGGGESNRPKPGASSRHQQDDREKGGQGKVEFSDGRGMEGDTETPSTKAPRATASLMFHALTSGLGVLGEEGPDDK